MTKTQKKEEILRRAINKAIDNGYLLVDKSKWGSKVQPFFEPSNQRLGVDVFIHAEWEISGKSLQYTLSVNDIIFSHDFAKAFWGEELKKPSNCDHDGECPCLLPAYRIHLQEQVLAEDPILYLSKFISLTPEKE